MTDKSIKAKLREQTKKNHEAFRQQLVDDVAEILKKWNQHSINLHDKQKRQFDQSRRELSALFEEVKRSANATKKIRQDTLAELSNLKRSQTWGFLALTVLVAIISTLSTLLAVQYLF